MVILGGNMFQVDWINETGKIHQVIQEFLKLFSLWPLILETSDPPAMKIDK